MKGIRKPWLHLLVQKNMGDKGGWLVFGWLVGLVGFKAFVIFVPKIGEMIQFD